MTDAKKIHDLKNIREDLKIMAFLIQSGYRFDDDQQPKILARLEQAQVTLTTIIDEIHKVPKN